jgi:mRNA interferase RelE/StbE
MERSSRRLKVPVEVARLVRGMQPDLKRKTRASLKAILEDSASGKPLKNELDGLRSFKVGTFRIIYRVINKTIEIIAIGPRVRIYEETYRLLKKGTL